MMRSTSSSESSFDVLTACSCTASFSSAFSSATGSACLGAGLERSAPAAGAAGRRYRAAEAGGAEDGGDAIVVVLEAFSLFFSLQDGTGGIFCLGSRVRSILLSSSSYCGVQISVLKTSNMID